MTLAIAIITDGRRTCFERTVDSLRRAWPAIGIDRVVVIDDSGDVAYAHWLDHHYGAGYDVIHHSSRRGFGGAIRSAWAEVGGHDYVFHLEDDFIFRRTINIPAMRALLDREPEVQQVALKRQRWGNEPEGGFMAAHPGEFHDEVGPGGLAWCWQRLFFTTNPSLYRGALTARGWPDGDGSERAFTDAVLADIPDAKFAYLRWASAEPLVEHIGQERVGDGY